jgi:hypothetical protein
MLKRTLLSLIFLGLLGCHHDEKDNAASQAPPNNAEYIEPTLLIIGHRGASALRPEHTLAAYQKAIDDGEVDVFGAQYAMRLWLNPHKLRQYGLMPSDIRAAVEAQNTQVAAGAIGE